MATLSVTILLFAMGGAFVAVTGSKCPVYVPDHEDIIRMDVEQRGPGGGWEFQEEQHPYGGSGYLTYKPWSTYGGAEGKPSNFFDERIKTYHFKVNREGTYRVMLRSSAPHHTEHNDIFMSLAESGAYMMRGGMQRDLSWPLSDEQISAGWVDGNTWFKVYQNRGGNVWHNGGVTKDHDGHAIVSRTLHPGGKWYSVRMCGRSTQFKVDRIIVFRCEGRECDSKSAKYWRAVGGLEDGQSRCEGGSAPNDNDAMFDESEGDGAGDVSGGQRGRGFFSRAPTPAATAVPTTVPVAIGTGSGPRPRMQHQPMMQPLPNIGLGSQRTAVAAP